LFIFCRYNDDTTADDDDYSVGFVVAVIYILNYYLNTGLICIDETAMDIQKKVYIGEVKFYFNFIVGFCFNLFIQFKKYFKLLYDFFNEYINEFAKWKPSCLLKDRSTQEAENNFKLNENRNVVSIKVSIFCIQNFTFIFRKLNYTLRFIPRVILILLNQM
jgi:hypothetical protein